MRRRGFEIIEDKFLDNVLKEDIVFPKRATNHSAGYDFFLPKDIMIKPNKSVEIKTYIKAYMEEDEVLFINIRSSLGVKKRLNVMNQMGIIDSDYYNNPDNDGNIIVNLINKGRKAVFLKKGERFVQGIFIKYLKADNEDLPKITRMGGFGSTLL